MIASVASLFFYVARIVEFIVIIASILIPSEIYTRTGSGGKRLEMILTAGHVYCPFTRNRTLAKIFWPFSSPTRNIHRVGNESDILNQILLLPDGSVVNDALKSYAICAHSVNNDSSDRIYDERGVSYGWTVGFPGVVWQMPVTYIMTETVILWSLDQEFHMARFRGQCLCDVRQSWTLLLAVTIFILLDSYCIRYWASPFYRYQSCFCKRCSESNIQRIQEQTDNRKKVVRQHLSYSWIALITWLLTTTSCIAFQLSWPHEYWTPDSLIVRKYFEVPRSWRMALVVAFFIAIFYALEIVVVQCADFSISCPGSESRNCLVDGSATGDWCCCRRSYTKLRETDDIFPGKCAHHDKCLQVERLRKRMDDQEAFDRRMKQSLTFRDPDQIKLYKNPGWLSDHRRQPSTEEAEDWSVISFPSEIKSRMKFCNPLSQRFEATYP